MSNPQFEVRMDFDHLPPDERVAAMSERLTRLVRDLPPPNPTEIEAVRNEVERLASEPRTRSQKTARDLPA